jgi:hypothetical protein
MIQRLRTMHLRTMVALAFVLPALIAAGLMARQRSLGHEELHAHHLTNFSAVIRKSDTLWQKHALQTVFYRDSAQPEALQVALHPMQGLNEPDLLLYWCTDQPQRNELSFRAQLIGPFIPDHTFRLMSKVVPSGYLVLFSLAHNRVIDWARVETLP